MSLKKVSHNVFLILLLVIVGCDFLKMKETLPESEVGIKPIVRVHENFLYPQDLEGIVAEGMSVEDSVDRVSRYIDNWARKQILISEASSKIEFDEAEIERKILDYRYSLIGYEYQAYYVNQHLDKEVSDEEVEEYYYQNPDNFALKQHIIRGVFINVPKEAPKTDKIKPMILSEKKKDKDELNSYCLSFATTYQLNELDWVNFEEVINNTPLAEIPNKVQFLRNNHFVETEDDNNLYFLKIEEYRISDETSPLEFERDRIKDIIINKRKVELANKLEQEVYEKAVKNNDFEIYN